MRPCRVVQHHGPVARGFGAGVSDDPARCKPRDQRIGCQDDNLTPLRPKQMKRPWSTRILSEAGKRSPEG